MGAAVASSRSRKQATNAQPTPAPAVSSEPTAPADSADNNIAQLEKLAELRDKGILTEEEFSAKKKQLLGL